MQSLWKSFEESPFFWKSCFNEIRIKFKGDEKKKKEKQESALILDLKQKKTSRPAHWLRSRFSHSWPGFDSQCSQDFYRPSI